MIKILFIAAMLINTILANANVVSEEQITKDVSVLADDKMAGRASFTTQSGEAADYIAQRFEDIGLVPLTGNKNFKQTFPLYQLQTQTVDIKLDDISIDSNNVLVLTAHDSINWDNKSSVNLLQIKATDSFAEKLQEFNQLEENLLITVSENHAEQFNRYYQYFSRPQNKFKINTGPSAVILLTSQDSFKNFNVQTQTKIEQRFLTNVVGVLPGNKKANEMVLFSAHYDHLGIKLSPSEKNTDTVTDNIYNGADDDASGTSAVINLAEYFSADKNNQRSLVFVAFAAEELGGFGSRYFSENIDPLKISAMLNIEMIGKPSKFGAGEFWMTGVDRSDLAEILNKNLVTKNKKIYADPYPEQRLFYRSDNATLARLGVPAHSFSSTQIDKDEHYHKSSDELKTLDLKSMSKIIQTIAESVETLVDGSDTPTRIDSKQVLKQGNYF